jgi:tetratricopeptide (TPR) repeat protein
MTISEKISMCRAYLSQKDQDRARQLLEDALITNPDHAEVIALRAVLYMLQAQYEKAIEYFEKAKELDPDLEMIYYNLAKSYRKSGRLDRAEEAARKALALNPANFQAHTELSCILFKTTRAKDAIDHLLEAIHINPDFLKAYLILGQLCKDADQTEDAMFVYRNALERLPDAHILREELCALYAAQQDFGMAYAFAAELAARRNLASDYVRAGNYARLLGSSDAAEAAFQKARELNPKVDRNL